MDVKKKRESGGLCGATRSHVVVTISRQMGSGGTFIGYEAASVLGFRYVDREILRAAAGRLGRDAGVLEAHEERSPGLLERFVRGLAMGSPENAYVPVERPVYEADLFEAEGRVIREIAEGGDAVIIGRGGFHVLSGFEGAIHVFIHGPIDFRSRRMMQITGVTDVEKAREHVEESDRRRSRFIRDMTGKAWTDALNYDLCIDAAAAGFPACVETIVSLVEARRGSS